MKKTIGYFLPEFPGQTHIFFWRERQILAELGIETQLISTRRPPQGIASHVWTAEAQKLTTYLVPFSFQDFVNAFIQIFIAGPGAWIRCLSAIMQAKDMPFGQKLRLLALIMVAGKLVWLAKQQGWTHIHVHSCADALNIAMFAAMISSLTYSLTLHGPTLELYGPNQEQKWQYATFATVISELLSNYVQELMPDYLPPKVAVAPMGVNLDVIKRHTPYIPWQTNSPCKIFACGRLNPIKGHQYLMETILLLRQKGYDVSLQIAGEDEQGGSGYHLELERFIKDNSLSEYVELLGAVSEGRIRQGLEAAHVFALASLNEGVPVAVMEAMAMEMPVVVTDVGGNSELIDNGKDAILVPAENPQAMADAIEKVLQNKELALSLAQASRQKIAAKFHHKRSAETLIQCLETLPAKK